MEYLVLKPFKSYGLFYHKGDVVTADKIRNLRIRLSEGKIVEVSEEPVEEPTYAVLSSPLLHAADEESPQEQQAKPFKFSVPADDSAVLNSEE